MIKIFHEAPIQLLEMMKKHTAGEYIIAPFLDKYPVYKEHMLKSAKDGRFIIMDNGLHEGAIPSTESLIEKIKEYKPNIFIVPDEWNDFQTTTRNAEYWISEIKPSLPEKTNLMAVVQAVDLNQGMTCYQTFKKLGYKYIAVNYSSEMYSTMFHFDNINVNRTLGRVQFFSELKHREILDETIHHHLLGASSVDEFKFYKDLPYVKSCDTSSPIIYGCEYMTYKMKNIFEKPKAKIEDYFESEITAHQMKCILRNLKTFQIATYYK